MRKNKRTAVIVIVYVLIVLALVGVAGIVLRFTNGGTAAFAKFYVTVGDNSYYDNNSGDYLLQSGDNEFETKYTFSINSADKHKGYDLVIVPDTDNDVEFTVDGEAKKLTDIEDYTAAFNVERTTTGFTIQYDGSGIDSVLNNSYAGKQVDIVEDIDYSKTYFKLKVTSTDGESEVIIGLKFEISVTGIILDKQEIIL